MIAIIQSAVVEDSFRWIRSSGQGSPLLKEITTKEQRIATLGSMEKTDSIDGALIERLTRKWHSGEDDSALRKLSLIAGTLCADVIRSVGGYVASTEGQFIQSTFLIRKAYVREADGRSSISVEKGAALLRTFLQRALVENHTFRPDKDDVEGWIDRLHRLETEFQERHSHYAQAIFQPDAALIQKYVTNTGFYLSDDPVILVLEQLRQTEHLGDDQWRAALEVEASSIYGRFVQGSIRNLIRSF